MEDMNTIKYCKAITKTGKPCLIKRKKGCAHCHVHDKTYESCDICMDNMYKPVRLMCGHTLCSACSTKWNSSTCPFCRKHVHPIHAEQMRLSGLFESFHNARTKETRTVIYVKLMDMFFTNFHLLTHENLRNIITKKIHDHKNLSFYEHHKKLLESSLEKLNII